MLETEQLQIGNWVEMRQKSLKLGQDTTKLSCVVANHVHTADTDKTVLSCPCRRCEQAIGSSLLGGQEEPQALPAGSGAESEPKMYFVHFPATNTYDGSNCVYCKTLITRAERIHENYRDKYSTTIATSVQLCRISQL